MKVHSAARWGTSALWAVAFTFVGHAAPWCESSPPNPESGRNTELWPNVRFGRTAWAQPGPSSKAKTTAESKTNVVVGTVAIDIRTGSEAPPWLAPALEEHIERELSAYERLRVARRDAPVRRACGADIDCTLRRYRALDVDVVLVATAGVDVLRYELYETWTPSKMDEGALALRNISGLIGLRQRVLQIFNPVLTPGGLLDQKPFRPDVGDRRTPTSLTAPPPTRGLDETHRRWPDTTTLLGIGLFFALPLVFAAFTSKARFRTLRWGTTWIALIFFAAAASPLAPTDIGSAFLKVTLPLWLTGLMGGVAWSGFILSNIRLAAPALPGLDRVAHRDVFRLLRAWAFVCGLRCAFLAAYYLPFAIAVRAMFEAWPIPEPVDVLVVVPVVGLCARLWLDAWIQAFAALLDRRLVVGAADRTNPWHEEITRYLRGSLRRTGWSIDDRRLETMVFLPGQREGLHCYGGGSGLTRVVIDERTLTVAIGGHDAKTDADAIDVPDWSAGFMMPHAGRKGRRVRARANGGLTRQQDRLTSDTGHQRKQLGQAATLLGYVRPEPGQHIPLIADTVEDLEVVRAMLSEHYQWFAPDPDDDHDDTDPTDKDFLFGVLIFSVGKRVRQSDQLETLKLAAVELSGWLRPLFRWLTRPTQASVGRASTILADAYVALHFARHHHLQYLFYRWTGREDHLTVRATMGEFERTSKEIILEVRSQLPPKNANHRDDKAVFRRRIMGLSRFFAAPLVDRTERRLQTIIVTLCILVGLYGLTMSVRRAVRYHPIYIERMAEQRQQRQAADASSPPNEGTASHVRQTDSAP